MHKLFKNQLMLLNLTSKILILFLTDCIMGVDNEQVSIGRPTFKVRYEEVVEVML